MSFRAKARNLSLLIVRDVSTPPDMTEKFFAKLDVFYDITPRSAATNMAFDEALLELATAPSLRLYRWDHPALSFGYFGRFANVAEYERDRDLVRRWTGGGMVLHGDDLTYSIIIPANDPSFIGSPLSTYETIHRALRNALLASGQNAELVARESKRISEACFGNPVRADVVINGQKVAGAAQRRTRRGLLQQGSIQNVDLGEEFGEAFASQLTDNCYSRELHGSVLKRAEQIAEQKYGTDAWLRRR
jgi:lipoate-protein ligase A